MSLLRLTLLFLLLIPGRILSQRQNFTIFSIDEGIPQSQVHCILQDKQGYIWFGTDGGGASRYDGKRFRTFTMADGLCNDLVYDMAADTGTGIWLATAKGVSRIHKGKPVPVPAELNVLADLMIRSVAAEPGGKVWFGTSKGLFFFSSGKVTPVNELEGLVISSLYLHSNGMLYAGTTTKGFFEISPGLKISNRTTENGLPHSAVHAFMEWNGELLIGTERGMCKMNPGGEITVIHAPLPPEVKMIVRDLLPSVKGGYWVATLDFGIHYVQNGVWTKYGRAEGLGVDGHFCVTEDHEGNLWVGTDGNGAARLGKQLFTSYGKEQGMSSEMILSILKTSGGEWWYGNQEGVTRFDGTKYTHYGKKEGLTDEKVWSVTEDQKGDIWITTYGSGIFIYNGSGFRKLDEKAGLSSNNVRAVFHDSKERVWIATANGLNLIRGKNIQHFFKPQGTGTDRFLRVYESEKGDIWVGTSGGGILKVKEDGDSIRFERYSAAEGLADDVVLTITEDKNGRIWTGNFGGISCVDPVKKEVRKITRMEGLSSNTVYAIAFINDSLLLVGTNNGIDKLNIREWEKSGKVHTVHYGKAEGFFGVECNTASVWKEHNGNIWFGSIKGLFRYDPSKDKMNTTPPLLRLGGIRLFFREEDLTEFGETGYNELLPGSPEFPYSKNHLTFEMSALSYQKSSGILFSYRVEGIDKDWSLPSTDATVTYSNLPPGKFEFQFRACNGDGVWSEDFLSYSFTLTPPFWKTWWFTGSLLLFLAFTIWLFITLRLKRMKAVQLYLEQQVSLKTRELREEKELVEKQNVLIGKKNKDITSSIHYARRIQESILPNPERLNDLIPEAFIFFRPKDIVSGDFYWFTTQNGCTLIAAVDCTGHGVPGAFMSLIGNNLLNHIANDLKINDPKALLEKLHQGVVNSLKKNEIESDTVDGMDVSLCVVHHKEKKLEYAATGRPLFYFRNGKGEKLKIGKQPVGLVTKKAPVFEKAELELKTGDTFYILTDGFCDQFGGPDEEKFMEGRCQELLQSIQNTPLADQKRALEKAWTSWKGELPQIDDILVIGCRMP
ncbi:MAG: SpoIIE family protein phosphatase [Bacteroidia bacterium]|nr:SpoIIE family protein phosphatase [Bacteroidia bacterium]